LVYIYNFAKWFLFYLFADYGKNNGGMDLLRIQKTVCCCGFKNTSLLVFAVG